MQSNANSHIFTIGNKFTCTSDTHTHSPTVRSQWRMTTPIEIKYNILTMQNWWLSLGECAVSSLHFNARQQKHAKDYSYSNFWKLFLIYISYFFSHSLHTGRWQFLWWAIVNCQIWQLSQRTCRDLFAATNASLPDRRLHDAGCWLWWASERRDQCQRERTRAYSTVAVSADFTGATTNK